MTRCDLPSPPRPGRLWGPTHSIILWVPAAKRPGHEACDSLPFSINVKNAWSYTSTPQIRLHGVVLKYLIKLSYWSSNQEELCLPKTELTLHTSYTKNCVHLNSAAAYSKWTVEKLIVARLVTKSPAFYGTRSFISLSWARRIQPTPSHPIPLRSILISFHLHLGFPSDSFLQVFWPKFCIHFSSPARRTITARHKVSILLRTEVLLR
jgi:hypothetical protein